MAQPGLVVGQLGRIRPARFNEMSAYIQPLAPFDPTGGHLDVQLQVSSEAKKIFHDFTNARFKAEKEQIERDNYVRYLEDVRACQLAAQEIVADRMTIHTQKANSINVAMNNALEYAKGGAWEHAARSLASAALAEKVASQFGKIPYNQNAPSVPKIPRTYAAQNWRNSGRFAGARRPLPARQQGWRGSIVNGNYANAQGFPWASAA